MIIDNEIDLKQVIDPQALGLLVNANSHPVVNRWLARGDGVVVYCNQAFDSAQFGHRIFLSYGSPAAQIDSVSPPEGCPVQLAGMTGAWAYRREFVCPPGRETITPSTTAERALIDEREATAELATSLAHDVARALRPKRVRR